MAALTKTARGARIICMRYTWRQQLASQCVEEPAAALQLAFERDLSWG
jgi:hypothetical protein